MMESRKGVTPGTLPTLWGYSKVNQKQQSLGSDSALIWITRRSGHEPRRTATGKPVKLTVPKARTHFFSAHVPPNSLFSPRHPREGISKLAPKRDHCLNFSQRPYFQKPFGLFLKIKLPPGKSFPQSQVMVLPPHPPPKNVFPHVILWKRKQRQAEVPGFSIFFP